MFSKWLDRCWSAEIFNCSYREGKLPLSWKNADIVPVLKQKPAKDVNKDLRPISLTPILPKAAEEFVIQEYVKPAILKEIDSCQYGSTPKSSTTLALISMVHVWTKYTDGNTCTVRVVLFDYKKAFDLIDHTILTEKLTKLDFLKCCKQQIKLSNDCKSEWSNVPAGVPQGTKLQSLTNGLKRMHLLGLITPPPSPHYQTHIS